MTLPYAEVIGDPIAHSKSPLIHKYWLERLRLAGDYRRTRVNSKALPEFLSERRADPEWRGCNVTIPHKEFVLAFMDELDSTAAAVGAANCIVRSPVGLTGYNTDVDGIAAALRGVDLTGQEVAIIGGGGAARAVLSYLTERGAAKVTLLLRDPSKAEPLRSLATIGIAPIEAAETALRTASLIVNASPLGMTGCAEMPRNLLDAVSRSNATLFDMVYDPLKTAFLATGSGKTIDGLTMLVSQAARAFELFFGEPAPVPDRGLIELLTSKS